MGERTRTRWQRWWPFGLVVLVGAGRWLLAAAVPAAASTVGSEAAGCGGAALLCWGVGLAGRKPVGPRGDAGVVRVALAGAMMLTGPLVGLVMAAGRLDSTALMMALTLTPVVAGVAVTAGARGEAQDLAGRVWPGLAAVAGLLLVLPQPVLSDWRNDAVLLLAPLLTGTGAAWLGGLRNERTDTSAGEWAELSGVALVFGLALVVEVARGAKPWGISAAAAALDGVVAWVAVRALVRLGTMRWTAQFTLVPLAVLLEGMYFLRPRLDARALLGIAMVAVASVFLLLPPGEADEGLRLS